VMWPFAWELLDGRDELQLTDRTSNRTITSSLISNKVDSFEVQSSSIFRVDSCGLVDRLFYYHPGADALVLACRST
jgi:hypothetical protein